MLIEPKKTTIAYRCPQCGSGVMSAVGMFTLSADRIVLRCSNPECPTYKENEKRKKQEAGRGTEHPSPRSNEELDIVYFRDSGDVGKVRLTVPCIFCGKPHTFTVNTTVFFGKEVFLLSCPYSGINICFMGEHNHVKAELARSELELLDMLEENGIEDFRGFEGDEKALPDPQIYEIIMFVIHDLDAEGKIYCKCTAPHGQERNGESASDSDSTSESTSESACACGCHHGNDGDDDDGNSNHNEDSNGNNGEYDDNDREYDAEVTENGILIKCRKCGAQKVIRTDSLISAHDFLNCDSLTLE